jgi:hypothetical protein
MGLILVQVQKKITAEERCGVWWWGKFEQLQFQIPKGSSMVEVIWLGLGNTLTIQINIMFGCGG